MTRRPIAVLAAVLVAVLSACSSAAGPVAPAVTPSVQPDESGVLFYAAVAGGGIDEVSAQTGKVIKRVGPGKRNGMSVAGLARFSADVLLVTYSIGPACTSNINGCGPKPDTCGGEVDALNLASGAITTLWRVGRDQRLTAARLSPDRTMLAALASPCVPSYFNDHLVVRRLRDGASWNIGDRVPRCHLLRTPQWTADSAHLLVSFAPPTGTSPYTGADGTCTGFGDSHVVQVDAGHAQPLISGTTVGAPAGCTYQALATSAARTYAVQACGPDQPRLQGPATLVRLDETLRVTQHRSIGECTDGNDLAADPAKGVLLAAYLFCNPPLAGHKLGEPVTVLDRLVGAHLHRIASASGGELAFDDLTW